MIEICGLILLLSACVLLVILCVIDLKIRILPDIYNAAFALTAIAFHMITGFQWLAPIDALIGACIGGGFLYAVRLVANHLYQKDTLGLGDVKLLAAAGLWLGPENTLLAIILGACAGIAHGGAVLMYQKIKQHPPEKLSQFAIPAGPGFAIGIVIAGYIQYYPFIIEIFA